MKTPAHKATVAVSATHVSISETIKGALADTTKPPAEQQKAENSHLPDPPGATRDAPHFDDHASPSDSTKGHKSAESMLSLTNWSYDYTDSKGDVHHKEIAGMRIGVKKTILEQLF